MMDLVLIAVVLLIVVVCGVLRHYHKKSIRLSSTGKTVLITGCDTGFGNTLAQLLDEKGYKVFACCLNENSDGANQLRRSCSERLTIYQVDVTNEADVQSIVHKVTGAVGEGGLWALVNNAGVAVFAETEWCSMESYHFLLNVNLLGMIRVTKAFLPLVRRCKGRVVNFASLAGRVGLPGFTAYSASKFGVIGFSDSLRREMKKFKVSVITIEPSLYRTPITAGDFHVKRNEEMWEQTSDIVREDYGSKYHKAFMDNMLKLLLRTSRKTHRVIADLMHAIEAKHPRTRYVPKLRTYLLSNALQTLPYNVQDFLINKVMPVCEKPAFLEKVCNNSFDIKTE